MLYSGITLPKVGNLDSQAERKKIMNALYEIDEKLRLVLNNIDLDNLSGDLADQLVAVENAIQQFNTTGNEVYIAELRGRLADMNVILDGIIEVNNQQATDIQRTSESITSTAQQITTLTGTVEGIEGRVTAQEELTSTVLQTAEQFSIQMEKVTTIESAQETIQQQLETHFDFDVEGLRISSSDSDVSTLYDADGMHIQDTGGNDLANFTADGAVIQNKLAVGTDDYGYFEIVVNEAGFTIKLKE